MILPTWLEHLDESFFVINAQVASGGKVPGGCNCSQIPKVLEHPTGLPNLQPSHEPPAQGSQQAPVTHKPNGSVEKIIHMHIFQKEGGTAKL